MMDRLAPPSKIMPPSTSSPPATSNASATTAQQRQIILLIHGIRTFAHWQHPVKAVLEKIPNTTVIPIRNGYLSLFCFLLPFYRGGFFVDDIRRQIQFAMKDNSTSRVSVIAHSFGTYAITKILHDIPNIKLHTLVLAGSIVHRNYRWDHVQSQVKTVVNDYGFRDYWPVFAVLVSWCFGDTGWRGFGRGGIINDRGHDVGHSGCLTETFARQYWKPLFESDKIVPSGAKEPVAPLFISMLTARFPIHALSVVAILALCSYWASFRPGATDCQTAGPPTTTTEVVLPRVEFVQIEMVTRVCKWKPIQRPFRVVAPIRNRAGEFWKLGGPPIGVPRDLWPLGSEHEFPRIATDHELADERHFRTRDPVIDVALLNRGPSAAVLSRVGIRPVCAWTSPKGPPIQSGKIIGRDEFTLEVRGFVLSQDQWLVFEPNVVNLAPNAPYQLRLQLKNYCQEVRHNESAIQLLMMVDQQVVSSDPIYLGMF